MLPLDQPPPIVCSIVQQQVGHRVQVRGRVVGRQEAQGNFSLQVIKSGPSGSSTISQSGTFSINAGREKLLGLAVFNTEPGVHFTAELSLRVDRQTFTCKTSDERSQ
jgi:hypothetical protein